MAERVFKASLIVEPVDLNGAEEDLLDVNKDDKVIGYFPEELREAFAIRAKLIRRRSTLKAGECPGHKNRDLRLPACHQCLSLEKAILGLEELIGKAMIEHPVFGQYARSAIRRGWKVVEIEPPIKRESAVFVVVSPSSFSVN